MRGAGRRRAQLLVALAGAAVLLFNFPLLLIWDRGQELFALPMLPVALFLIWAGLIAALALASETGPRSPRSDDRSGPRGGLPRDRNRDGGSDGEPRGRPDEGPDTGSDTGSDTGPDTGPDAGPDTGPAGRPRGGPGGGGA